MTSANFAVHADAIIPVAGPENVLKSHSIVVRQGLIDALMPHAQARALSDVDHVELSGHLLMPGLVNAHGHAGMTLLRGYADDMSLASWLNDKIWPLEARWVSPEFVRDGTDIAAAECYSVASQRPVTCISSPTSQPRVCALRACEHNRCFQS